MEAAITTIDSDPEIQALRAARERAERLLESRIDVATHTNLHALIPALKASLKASTRAMQLAALEDAVAGDLTFPRAAAVQRQTDDDRRRLEAAEAAYELGIVNVGKCRLLLSEWMDGASHALREALLKRKQDAEQ
jgi:hypothetical protein